MALEDITPAISAPLGTAYQLVATAVDRKKAGYPTSVVLLEACTEKFLALQTVLLTDQADRQAFAARAAQQASLPQAEGETALLALYTAIEGQARRQLPPTPHGSSLAPEDPAADLGTVSPCTHVANARRIVRRYDDRLRHVEGRGWILWTGTYWQTDTTQESTLATCFVSELATAIAREAEGLIAQATQEADPSRRKTLFDTAEKRLKWAVQSENVGVISAGLRLATGALQLPEAAMNSDPCLLNVQNGTLNLRTGTLQPHDPTDFMTHICPVAYDPQAPCPTWDRFLTEVFDNDPTMVQFVQRALGYSLTGLVHERALFLLFGPQGTNGKTTLVETFAAVLGDSSGSEPGYARKVDIHTFMKSKNQEENLRKVVQLAGPRFVYTSEIDAEHRLNEQLVKDMTGGDTLEARRLFRESFTFAPRFTPWMYGNHKPNIRGTDNAIWTRVKLIEFPVSFQGREDRALPRALLAERAGILHWALQGCLAWQREGLNPPDKVINATQQYRAEQDVIGRFIQERCAVVQGNESVRTRASALYDTYKNWCAETGESPTKQKEFGTYLTTNGFPSDENCTGRGAWRFGIGILADEDPQSATHTATHDHAMGSTHKSLKNNENHDEKSTNATLATHNSRLLAGRQSSIGEPGNKGSMGSIPPGEIVEGITNQEDVDATHLELMGSTFTTKGSTFAPKTENSPILPPPSGVSESVSQSESFSTQLSGVGSKYISPMGGEGLGKTHKDSQDSLRDSQDSLNDAENVPMADETF